MALFLLTLKGQFCYLSKFVLLDFRKPYSMALQKKGLFLIAGIYLLLASAFTSFYRDTSTPDALLKKARSIKEKNEAIRLAKRAFDESEDMGYKTGMIRSLNYIAEFWGQLRRYDSTRFYANDAIKLADRYNIDSLKGNSYIYLGNADYWQSHIQSALDNYNKAASEYKKINKLSDLATCWLNIGVCEQKLANYIDAIKYYVKASEIYENLKDAEYLSSTYNSIADCFVEQNNFEKALYYNKAALSIRKKSRDVPATAESLNNIGFLYNKYLQADSAIKYLESSLNIYRAEKDSSQIILTLQNLGTAWKMKNDLVKAERYITRSLKIANKYNLTEENARGHADLASVYILQHKYGQALTSIDTTIKIAQQRHLKELLMQAYGIKSEFYNEQGDYKNALLYANKKTALKDSLFTEKQDEIVNELDVKFRTKQRESNIAALSQQNKLQNRIVLILSTAAVFLLISFAIAYINFRKKNEANERIQNLMREMHHRVKNNLQILSGLFSMQINNLSDEKTKAALRENEARLTSMNLIHNKLYLDNTTTKIEMNDYLTKLLNHIKDSFSGYKQSEVDLKIEVNEIMLEADKAVAIGLIANELATNAFKYAFADRPNGEIRLALTLVEKSKVLLTLADNGIGLKETDEEKAPSFGLKLVNLMARQLNSSLVVKSEHGMFYQMEISI